MHAQAFSGKAAELFPHFSRFKKFYLVGGTALALQIGHRRSVDFDFFLYTELPENLLQQVKRQFPGSTISVSYRAHGQLTIFISDIKVTFFAYPYPVLEPFVRYQSINIASINEIAAMKAFAIGKRLSYKDYVDWYFLLKDHHIKLERVIKFAQKKFGSDFNDRLFLGQLISLEDIQTQEIDFLGKPVNRSTVEQFLKTAVRKFKL